MEPLPNLGLVWPHLLGRRVSLRDHQGGICVAPGQSATLRASATARNGPLGSRWGVRVTCWLSGGQRDVVCSLGCFNRAATKGPPEQTWPPVDRAITLGSLHDQARARRSDAAGKRAFSDLWEDRCSGCSTTRESVTTTTPQRSCAAGCVRMLPELATAAEQPASCCPAVNGSP